MFTVLLPPRDNPITVNKYISINNISVSVERRLAVILNLSPKVTTITIGHGNIRSYLQRLKIIGSSECPRKHGIQTADHLIFQCNGLKNERETLKKSVLKEGSWSASKIELTYRYLKQFIRYINSTYFEKINHSNKQM